VTKVEVAVLVTFTLDVDAVDPQAAIEHVWDEWHTIHEDVNTLAGIVNSGAHVELHTVDGLGGPNIDVRNGE